MLEIRSIYSDADYSDVCQILLRAQKAESQKTGVLYNTSSITPSQFTRDIEQYEGVCFCAYVDGVLAGTLSVFSDNRKKWYSKDGSDKIIKYVGVAPEYQGMGIASQLVEYAKSNTNYQVLSVSTGEMNQHAIHLYKKNGFILVDITRGPIHNAYKLAFWKEGCPIRHDIIKMHLIVSKIKCFIKRLLSRSKVNPDQFR